MRRAALACLAACLALALAGPTPGPLADEQKAVAMNVPESGYRVVEVVAEKSLPPKFELVLATEMPTPGWTAAVDAVDTHADERRIVARVTLTRPGDGMHAQVITETKLRIPIGTVEPGPWFLELWTRRGPDTEYAPAWATVLKATS